MKRIKVQNLTTGETKYILRTENHKIQVGETLKLKKTSKIIWQCLEVSADWTYPEFYEEEYKIKGGF